MSDATDVQAARVHRAEGECDRFEAAWKAGQRPRIEDHLTCVPELERPALLRELILLEVDYRQQAGEHPQAEEFFARFPGCDRASIRSVLAGIDSRATAVSPPTAAGSELDGRLGKFLLLEKLGTGGFGTVWRARDTELDRIVAIKIPESGRFPSAESRARFRREARAAARLSHPNVVMLLDVDQVGDTSFLVMEYVEGQDLGRLVASTGPLPVRQACDFVRQAALGLQHAHERGLVHRDIKPANLLVTAQATGRAEGENVAGQIVKVADLGLARLLPGPQDVDSALTHTGSVMGTADFIAPEQGRDTRNADARADIYSLGCSLYYLLTGKVPFPGGTFTEKIVRHVTEEAIPLQQLLPAVRPALAALVSCMMARRPEDRPQTAAAVAASLRALLDPGSDGTAGPLSGRAGSAPKPATRPWRRWRAAVSLLLGAAVLVVVGLTRPWQWLEGTDSPAPPAPAPADRGPEQFLTNSVGMELALIRPGRFWMGSLQADGKRNYDEIPHEVEITRAYYIGVCEVTQGQFQAVMKYNPSYFSADGAGRALVEGQDTSQHPVESITWEEARRFCEALSARPIEQQAGRKYRLPTEAEWEYACRAGSQGTYHFGRDAEDLGSYAWYQENAEEQTHPIKQKRPNEWKLHDMYGNVWEWCEDCYDPNYYRHSPAKDPLCAAPSGQRVLRGGGWGEYGSAWWCRSASRGRNNPTTVANYHGLRVVFTVP
jgi:formylglycine-generating enzyme required for sulfatase activity